MGNAEIERLNLSAQQQQLPTNYCSSSQPYLWRYNHQSALMKCFPFMFNLSFEKRLKNAAQWQIPDAEGYAKALSEKNVLMRSNPLNMKLTRSITSNGQTPFCHLWFWLRRKLARTFNSAINFKNRIRGLGKNHKTPVFP